MEKKIYNEKMSEKEKMATSQETIRINKYLSEAGICSRREADRLIAEGRIQIDGKFAEMGDRITAASEVFVDGRRIEKEEKKVLLLFYKPTGIVCSTKKQREEVTVTEFLDYPVRIYPVGRLDKESEGLLLMTNQGDLLNKIMRAGNYHEKEYLVKTDRVVTEAFIQAMQKGVPVLDTVTRPCFAEKTGKNSFRIILTQGLNRQIRRMCEYFGYQVISLKRIRIMHLTLGDLKPGEYREIRENEWKELKERIAKSSSETVKQAGGQYADSYRRDEKNIRKTSGSIEDVLPGRPRDHEQLRVRRDVRSAGKTGEGKRHRSGRISDSQRRI